MPPPDRAGDEFGAGGPGPAGRPASAGAGSPWPSPWRSCRKRWRRWISRPWPPGLGATYGEEAGRPYLALPYFGYCLQVFKDELRYPPGALADPWDAILLYNYIASQGQEPVAGRDWIAYNSLPNSVSKAKTLARLEQKLADHFAGQAAGFKERADQLGGEMVAVGGEDADVQAVFLPLPRVPLLLLFWDAEAEEGFAPQAAFSSTPASPPTWTWKPCSFWWNT